MSRRDLVMFALGAPAVLTAVGKAAGVLTSKSSFSSNEKKIAVQVYRSEKTAEDAPLVVLLHGSGGPRSQGMAYDRVATRLAEKGYRVWLPHYLDATGGTAVPPVEDHYELWVRTVQDAITNAWAPASVSFNKVCLIGYSLGASIALATACMAPKLGGVVSCSGSLPDEFFPKITTLPPLLILHGEDDEVIPESNARQISMFCEMKQFSCDLQVYPKEGHAFSRKTMIDVDQRIDAFLSRRVPV